MNVSSQQEAYRNIQFYLAAIKDVARADGNRTREIGAESLLESLEMLKPTERNEPYPGSYAEVVMLLHERDGIIAGLRARPTLNRERVLEVLGNTLTEVFNCCSGYMRPSEGHDVFPPCATWRQRTTIADAIIAAINNDH